MESVILKLFVLGDTPRSRRAIEAVERLCAQAEAGEQCDFTVIDLEADPAAADEYNIIAAPVLVRERPRPARQVVGDLQDLKRVVESLELPFGLSEM